MSGDEFIGDEMTLYEPSGTLSGDEMSGDEASLYQLEKLRRHPYRFRVSGDGKT